MTSPPAAFAPPATFMGRLFGTAPVLGEPPPRVTRWYGVRVQAGGTERLPRAQGRLIVHCRSGAAWITHDGDPKDVILAAGQSYAPQHAGRLTVHAMHGDCALEIQVDPLH